MVPSDGSGEAHSSAGDVLIAQYERTVEALSETQPPDRHALLELLALREHIADAAAQLLPSPEEIEAIAVADRALIDASPWLASGARLALFGEWRQSIRPKVTSWWWCLDELDGDSSGLSPVCIAVAGAFLVTALALMTDVTVRLLSGGVDLLGLTGTMAQSFIVFLAGGVLTSSGRQWLSRILRWRRVARKSRASWTISWSAALLLLAIVSWLSLKQVSRSYSNEGARMQIRGDLSGAIDSYTRALRANPNNGSAHYNLATAQELLQDPESAIVHYRAAIMQDGQMYPAYNNLARVYIVTGKPSAAVELLRKCIEQGRPDDKVVKYAFHKNLAWAYMELGLFRLCEKQIRIALELRDGAAAHCIRAQVIEKVSTPADAVGEWQLCLSAAAVETSAIEPQWLGMAEERILAGDR